MTKLLHLVCQEILILSIEATYDSSLLVDCGQARFTVYSSLSGIISLLKIFETIINNILIQQNRIVSILIAIIILTITILTFFSS